jgi:hypothetical protein
MTERDFAITNKAACYGLAAFTVLLCAAAHLLGSRVAFECGVLMGVAVVPISELLIVIPKPNKE